MLREMVQPMSRRFAAWLIVAALVLGFMGVGARYAFYSANRSVATIPQSASTLEKDELPHPSLSRELEFSTRVRPFLDRYCVSCHAGKKPKGDLDLSRDTGMTAAAANLRQWELVHERLQSQERPPDEAKQHPTPNQRAQITATIRAARDHL